MTLKDLLKVTKSKVVIMKDEALPELTIHIGFDKNCLSEEYLNRKVAYMYAYYNDVYVRLEYEEV